MRNQFFFEWSNSVFSCFASDSKVISQVCGNYEMTHFGVVCHYYKSADGTSKRCYCDTDLCNSAPYSQRPALTLVSLAAALLTAVFTRFL